ncbi:cobyric acid synthase [Bacteroidales bacterium]|nr:cobyric acid synthase [Bacteroidales bacterium]
MKQLAPIMFAGTGSDVGKTVIAAAFCRIFLQDGYNPAPFKAQNMALNSYATPLGLEIGRAQAVQAEAAGIDCHTDMNPLLLKPCTDKMAQVVLNGRVVGNMSAQDYFKEEGRDLLRAEVNGAFDRLQKRYMPIVMEGAGSISEINLRSVDLVNMPMAIHAKASVILVADIDRGGVFGSIYGSIMLLTPQEKARVKGILINKFRGDISLFESGISMLEELCGIPVIGVVPYFKEIYIEEEDSMMLETKNIQAAGLGKVNIVVVLLRHLSNFTDFNTLERDQRVHLYYSNKPEEIEKADIILIPGSKSTIADLQDIRQNGVAKSILNAHKNGKTVMGICGGYQMMGQELSDPLLMEGNIECLPGLGLLPLRSCMEAEKISRQVEFKFLDSKEICKGYEIHIGHTTTQEGYSPSPLNFLEDGSVDGFFLDQTCFGTYIHGILDNGAFVDFLLLPFVDKKDEKVFDFKTFKEEQYNKLADHVRTNVNMKLVYDLMQV